MVLAATACCGVLLVSHVVPIAPPRFPRQPRSADDPWDWAEVRGRVVETVDGREAREHIDKLSRKYVGTDYGMPVGPDGRIILKIAADRVNTPKTLGRRY